LLKSLFGTSGTVPYIERVAGFGSGSCMPSELRRYV
jgi:hypothetical protein